MNRALFKSILALKQCQNKEIAQLLGVTQSSFSVKIRLNRFSIDEIKAIQKKLALSNDEVHNIFFEHKDNK